MRISILNKIAVVCLGLFLTQTASADYVAYSVGKKSKSPLPENVDNIDTKYLLSIEWGSYSGRKARLGVLAVDNNSTANSFSVTTSAGNVD